MLRGGGSEAFLLESFIGMNSHSQSRCQGKWFCWSPYCKLKILYMKHRNAPAHKRQRWGSVVQRRKGHCGMQNHGGGENARMVKDLCSEHLGLVGGLCPKKGQQEVGVAKKRRGSRAKKVSGCKGNSKKILVVYFYLSLRLF